MTYYLQVTFVDQHPDDAFKSMQFDAPAPGAVLVHLAPGTPVTLFWQVPVMTVDAAATPARSGAA